MHVHVHVHVAHVRIANFTHAAGMILYSLAIEVLQWTRPSRECVLNADTFFYLRTFGMYNIQCIYMYMYSLYFMGAAGHHAMYLPTCTVHVHVYTVYVKKNFPDRTV